MVTTTSIAESQLYGEPVVYWLVAWLDELTGLLDIGGADAYSSLRE
jgi:hypothetical protein